MITAHRTVSLATPFFVPTPMNDDGLFVFDELARTPFVYGLEPQCDITDCALLAASDLKAFPSTVSLLRLHLSNTIAALSSVISGGFWLPTATAMATATTKAPSSSHPTQSPSAGITETRKLIIGFVVAIVVSVILVTIFLSSFCIFRRRRRRKEETAASNRSAGRDEGNDTQLYFQQKVELHDEQRRHEKEALELRHEMEGEDRIYEMP